MKTYFCSFVVPFITEFYLLNCVNMIILGIWGTKKWFEYYIKILFQGKFENVLIYFHFRVYFYIELCLISFFLDV